MFDISGRWTERRFRVLVATLSVYLFVLAPLCRQTEASLAAGPLLFSMVILSGVYVCAARTAALRASLFLGVPTMLLLWADYLQEWPAIRPVVWLLLALFVLFLLVVCSREVLRARRITSDIILGAIAVYLLVAMAWAVLYALLESVDHGAFHLPDGDVARTLRYRAGEMAEFIYFSFVTMTTLGYGDILPVSPVARGLTTLEALFGQIYMAVLVARLVALNVAHVPPVEDD